MRVQRLQLDFAPRPARPVPVAVALFVAGVAVLAAAAVLLTRQGLAQAALREEAARLEAGAARPAARPAGKAGADARNAAQALATRQVAMALERPWDDLLAALELRPSADVALLAVEPSATRHTVRITAEARTQQAMLQHLALLQADSRLTGVWLVSHQRQQQAPGNPWRYQIQGAW